MSRIWKRSFRLMLDGSALDLSNLRVAFEIRDQTRQSPRTAIIRVTNLSEATAQAIRTRPLPWKVSIVAGYEENVGRIFTGDVKGVRKGKENPTDTYLDIFAADGDRAYNRAVVQKTLPAGSTGKDIYDTLLKAMAPFGVSPGFAPTGLAQKTYPRAITLYGMARDHMRTLAQSVGGTWNIQNFQVNVVPTDGALPGGVIRLNSTTGLVGLPEQTELGIIARCLINPRIDVHSVVQIDEKSIQQAATPLGYGSENIKNGAPFLASISSDGAYKVLALDAAGDTRNNDWYQTLYCQATNGAPTQAQIDNLWGGEN